MKTFGQLYNEQVVKLMPHFKEELSVPEDVENSSEVDDIIFRRGEYLGGMANVICAVVEREESIKQLKEMLKQEDIQVYKVYTVVQMAAKDLEKVNTESAVSRLRIDADKLRMHSKTLYEYINKKDF